MVDSEFYVNDFERTVRSTIQPRNILIQRATPGSFTNVTSRSMVTRSSGTVLGSSAGAVGGAANTVTDQRKNEKREMQDLNERFAGYIEKVRFLEAQNRKLNDELEALKSRWGKQTTVIKTMYMTDLDQVKRLLEDCEKETQKLQIQVANLEEKIDEMKRKLDEANAAVDESRDKLEKQIQQIAEIESEVHLLRLRSDLLDGDKKYNKAMISRLQESLNRARMDFDAQSAEHDAAEVKRLSLEEELAFLREVHEQELRELAAQTYFDSTSSNRENWKSEMSYELKKLQEEYGEKIDELQNQMSLNYSMQVQSLNLPRPAAVSSSKEETIRLRTQSSELKNKMHEIEGRNDNLMSNIEEMRREKEERENEYTRDCEATRVDIVRMRSEMEAIHKEMEVLMDTKLGLEKEIGTYKKLLEGEQNEEGLKQVVDNMIEAISASNSNFGAYEGALSAGYDAGSNAAFSSSHSYHRKISSNGASSSVVGGRTSFQRSAKGPVSIAECSPDGKFIVLENTGKRREELGGYSLKRNVDGKDAASYTFKSDASLDPHSKIKLWKKGCLPSNPTPFDIEIDINDWGIGGDVITKLFNSAGQDRASHIQKTLA